ncbi:MAG: Imm44 family immunity protein [Candidatus Parcubacteria bacterium]|nr:Imm44 family immunity protein [Candidatus Parcubacteria bacterium]
MSFEEDGTKPEDKCGEKAREARIAVEPKIIDLVKNRTYSSIIHRIAIIPVIYSQELLIKFPAPERKYISHKNGFADFRLYVDYEKFINTSDDGRVKLLLKNIIDSIRIISARLKKDIKGEELENDILSLFNYNYEQLNAV